MDRRNDLQPTAPRPSLATPVAWIAGTALLTGTTFLVGIIALIRAVTLLVRF